MGALDYLANWTPDEGSMEGTEIGTGMGWGKQGEQNLKRAQNTAQKPFIPTPIFLEWGQASVAPETEHGHL